MTPRFELDDSVLRILREAKGPLKRDDIMRAAGFPSPSSNPVIAYVMFANSVMRINQRQRRHGRQIVGGLGTNETYWLDASAEAA